MGRLANSWWIWRKHMFLARGIWLSKHWETPCTFGRWKHVCLCMENGGPMTVHPSTHSWRYSVLNCYPRQTNMCFPKVPLLCVLFGITWMCCGSLFWVDHQYSCPCQQGDSVVRSSVNVYRKLRKDPPFSSWVNPLFLWAMASSSRTVNVITRPGNQKSECQLSHSHSWK